MQLKRAWNFRHNINFSRGWNDRRFKDLPVVNTQITFQPWPHMDEFDDWTTCIWNVYHASEYISVGIKKIRNLLNQLKDWLVSGGWVHHGPIDHLPRIWATDTAIRQRRRGSRGGCAWCVLEIWNVTQQVLSCERQSVESSIRFKIKENVKVTSFWPQSTDRRTKWMNTTDYERNKQFLFTFLQSLNILLKLLHTKHELNENKETIPGKRLIRRIFSISRQIKCLWRISSEDSESSLMRKFISSII